ncbi:MAG: DUF480 domain-containing protein [Planctomycetaceae bacterium]
MSDEPKNQIRQLTRIQRRVIGVLMEKAFTTPEQYPLTLKATTTACNQKSNREPVVSYDEDQVQQALDELREDLLVAEVFTDGGRAPRYRHYMRHKFDFSEAQFAIIAELLLRGRQQPGELRTRASRMVRIDSQEALREELSGLLSMGYLQANGPLERRGVEVDHTFYLPKEGQTLEPAALADDVEEPPRSSGTETPRTATQATAPNVAAASDTSLERLEHQIRVQEATIERLQESIRGLDERLQHLERDLGI